MVITTVKISFEIKEDTVRPYKAEIICCFRFGSIVSNLSFKARMAVTNPIVKTKKPKYQQEEQLDIAKTIVKNEYCLIKGITKVVTYYKYWFIASYNSPCCFLGILNSS
ncbi:MAG: hypothetical protein ACI9SG_000328 [Maribacter sp.]|jgi:hypothetical protein